MPRYFEFEVSLHEIEPRIWRRFLLPAEKSTFHDLHLAIQIAGDWWNYHLYQFLPPGEGFGREAIAGLPFEDDFDERVVPDAKKIRLSQYFGTGRGQSRECDYQYDFGDDWMHQVKLVGEVDLPEVFKRRLIAGERAFPHEDSGGTGGYERYREFVMTGNDPWDEDPEEIRAWLDGWHPERFDLAVTRAKFDKGPGRPKGPRVLAEEVNPGKTQARSKRAKQE